MLLPTELIGSYALPGWLVAVLERVEHIGDLGESDIRETLDDAVSIALLDQQRAGVDVITDGEMRRRDFIQSFYLRMSGVRKLPPVRTLGAAGYDQNPRWEVVDRLTAPAGIGIVPEVAYLARMTSAPFKVCVPGPITLALPLVGMGGYVHREAVLDDMIAMVNAEMKALVAAGATYLQVDEPRYATTQGDARRLVTIFNETRDGVDARIGLHVCFGNFKGRSRDRRDYQYLFPAINEARCDQINLEFANREFAQIELLGRIAPGPRLGVGVVDVKSYCIETPEDVAAGIRLALKHTPAERVVVTPDCGFNHSPRHVALGKLTSMVRGAAIVRRELEG